MSNATLPQNYQSWPGGAVACNLETRRGSFGDSEVNPITKQPRNFYGSLDLVEKLIVIVKWLAIMNLFTLSKIFSIKQWCSLSWANYRNIVSSSCFLTAAPQTFIIWSRSSWGRLVFHLSAMLLLIYKSNLCAQNLYHFHLRASPHSGCGCISYCPACCHPPPPSCGQRWTWSGPGATAHSETE